MYCKFIASCISKLSITVALCLASFPAAADYLNWEHFKLKFITEDGRVVDDGNGNVSHSEGQGTGMLLAVAHDDQVTFEKIWHWTEKNLGIRDDGLFTWQWLPDQENHTPDIGSASDGDILIGWAMVRAAEKWKSPDYLEIAKRVTKTIRTNLISEIYNYTLLLPGPVWPRRDGHTVINLSYWIFPAFEDFRNIDPSPQWEKLIQTGISLIAKTKFGSWDLPADWIAVKDDGTVSQVDGFSFVFGYESLRIPLFYLWGGHKQKEYLRIYQAFWSATARGSELVTVVGLATDTIIQQENVLAHQAVSQLINCAINKQPAPFLGFGLAEYNDYYSSVIYLLAQLTVIEQLPYCQTDGLVTDTNRLCGEGIKSQCPLADPIPEKIKKGKIVVKVQDFIQIPQYRTTRPLAKTEFLTHAGDGSKRIFVVDQVGKIYIIQNNKLLPEPFLNIEEIRGANYIGRQGRNELGLKALAFHPDYAKKGGSGYQYLYTIHTERKLSRSVSKDTPVFESPSGKIYHYDVVSEWRVDPTDPNRILPESQRELMRVAQPTRSHNVGIVAFDPTVPEDSKDYGLMYIGVGDGGWAEYAITAEYRMGQDLKNIFGKILRIDPQPGKDGGGYGIPDNNPFVEKRGNVLPEIWAYGLRNPKRISWDNIYNRMYIADIGYNNIEEVNLGVSGANYGWNHREGTFAINYSDDYLVTPLPKDDNVWNFTYPIAQYDHHEGKAISGGFIYRGKLIPELKGYYVFADISNGRIFYVDVENITSGQLAEIQELRLNYNGDEKTYLEILNGDYRAAMKLGFDEDSEIYVMTKRDGMIRKLLPMPKEEIVDWSEEGVDY